MIPSISTTDPAPIFTFPRRVAPAPIGVPSSIIACLCPSTFLVPPNVTWCNIATLLPMTAVSPNTTVVVLSNRTPSRILGAG
ncbi:hypothetical protein ACFX12_040312 [Malus domestica]